MVETLNQLKLLARVMAAFLLLSLSSVTARAEAPSLYDRLGGLAPISVVVSDFIDALMPDPILNSNPAIDAARTAVPASYLKYHVTAMMCQATGGPCQYHGRDMYQAHAHLSIQEAEWQRMIEVFDQILAKHQVPQQEVDELMAIMDSTKADIVASAK
ncbi:group 1 truncated hemoglobin [Ferrimonas sp. YFM]|uniref:group I truncated hemoglobin n=1 Tax=Ferrimonas sp. YFM TaxID=3028878 RepID=UPI0025736F41|nr:group 1 truncated hemoglobin [Ferrimonas sp. YFM]BDY04602.1 hypothetical protein F0521_16430 [Ferrimonas sp. YFM]